MAPSREVRPLGWLVRPSLGARLHRLASVRLVPTLLAVSGPASTARGTRSAVAVSSASAEPARLRQPLRLRHPLPLRRRLPLPRHRRALRLPQPRRRRAQPPRRRVQPRRRLCADRISASAAAPVSAVAEAARGGTVAQGAALPSPPPLSAAAECPRTEDVAARVRSPASPTVTAASPRSVKSASTVDAHFDRFPHGFPCTRSSHSALAAPAPAAHSTKRHRGGKRTGSGLCESRRGGLGPIVGAPGPCSSLIHPSAWNRNSAKFARNSKNP